MAMVSTALMGLAVAMAFGLGVWVGIRAGLESSKDALAEALRKLPRAKVVKCKHRYVYQQAGSVSGLARCADCGEVVYPAPIPFMSASDPTTHLR